MLSESCKCGESCNRLRFHLNLESLLALPADYDEFSVLAKPDKDSTFLNCRVEHIEIAGMSQLGNLQRRYGRETLAVFLNTRL